MQKFRAGGFLEFLTIPITNGSLYDITIGKGGYEGSGGQHNGNEHGSDSYFMDMIAYGGGHGGSGAGGSGGGGSNGCSGNGIGTYGQGHDGGNCAGGGGGAGGPGADHNGIGGIGKTSNISGSDEWYAGGGTGAHGSARPLGADGPGAGGGEGNGYGRPGVVIVSYSDTYTLPEITGDSSIAIIGGNKIITFNAESFISSKTASIKFADFCSSTSSPISEPITAPPLEAEQPVTLQQSGVCRFLNQAPKGNVTIQKSEASLAGENMTIKVTALLHNFIDAVNISLRVSLLDHSHKFEKLRLPKSMLYVNDTSSFTNDTIINGVVHVALPLTTTGSKVKYNKLKVKVNQGSVLQSCLVYTMDF